MRSRRFWKSALLSPTPLTTMASPESDDDEQADEARATAATRASMSMGAVRRWRLTRFVSLRNARPRSQSRHRSPGVGNGLGDQLLEGEDHRGGRAGRGLDRQLELPDLLLVHRVFVQAAQAHD